MFSYSFGIPSWKSRGTDMRLRKGMNYIKFQYINIKLGKHENKYGETEDSALTDIKNQRVY